MPINWNEVDRLKLEYIQQQETAKAKYEKELKPTKKSKVREASLIDYLIA